MSSIASVSTIAPERESQRKAIFITMPPNSRHFANVYEVSDSDADELWSEVTADGKAHGITRIHTTAEDLAAIPSVAVQDEL